MMRDGQPKCVCAPKCKTKNPRPKRVNHYSQLNNGHHHERNRYRSNQDAPKRSSSSTTTSISSSSSINSINNKNNSNRNGRRHHHHQNHQKYQSSHQRIHLDSDRMNQNIDVFSNRHPNNDRTQSHSDKIISIIAPSSTSSSIRTSNSNSSHSHKNSRNAIKSLQLPTERHLLATVHNSHSSKQRGGKINRNISNSSLIDNNIVNVNPRRQISSVEQGFLSTFHGHDLPYPPTDLAVSSILSNSNKNKRNKLFNSYHLIRFVSL